MPKEPYSELFPEADYVKRLRQERECSVYEAKHVALIELLQQRIETAETVEDLKPVLLTILTKLHQ